MKTLLLLDKKIGAIFHGNKGVLNLQKEGKTEDKALIVSMRDDVSRLLKKNKISFREILDYSKDTNLESNAMDLVKSISKSRTGNQNLKEIFSYDSFSIWWMMEDWLYYSFAYYSSIKKAVECFEKIYNLAEKENPKKIILYSDDPLTIKACKLVCRKKGIELKGRKNLLNALKEQAKTKIRIEAIKAYQGACFLIRRAIFRGRKAYFKEGKGGRKILIFATDDRWGTVPGIEKTIGDPYLYPILDELKKNKENGIIIMDNHFAYTPLPKLMRILRQKKESGINYDILENHLNKKTKRKVAERLRHFRSKYRAIRGNKDFVRCFCYRDTNIFGLVKKQFDAYFSYRLKGHLTEFEILKGLIKEKKPNVAVNMDESRAFSRALFHICKKEGIRTVAIQHGNLEGTIRCVHEKDEISEDALPDKCPIPDKTVVWGDFHKDFLLKNHYPSDKVEVLGCQRYDVLADAGRMYSKKESCKKLGIDPDRRIIALFTNSNFDEENKALLKATFDAVKKIPNVQLAVKPHPKENYRIHYQMKENTRSDAIIIRDIDSFELLHIADIVMIYWSTVGLEAMILDKPVIVINLMGQPDKVPYAKQGAAIGVYKEEDLAGSIKSILSDEEIQKKLKKNRDKLAYEYCYKKDGLASRRIAHLIENKKIS
ncbi:CDP-glycerol glycerophosphotransferase family protein [Candidatus Woesearchaeota archaeon]|nr:CDP-glycerol glycerophosphotransferase family protein [Candidatus Woesearchaeota archaeon]